MNTAEIKQPKLAPHNNAVCRMESSESEAVRRIEKSVAFMLQHLNGPLQVATLAAQANVSPSHFFALFKRQTGCAPIDCFIRLRMQYGCRLLDETGLSVKEVAAALGYDDPFYFSRIFKSVNHVAPSEYRLLRNGAKEAVRNCGIKVRFLPSPESRTELERAGSYPAQNRDWTQRRMGINIVAASGCRNSEKH